MLAGAVTFSDMLSHLERKFRINNPVYMSVRYRDAKGRQVFVAGKFAVRKVVMNKLQKRESMIRIIRW